MQLIFSFFRHPQLGLSLNAYLVHLLESGAFSYRYQRLVYDRLSDYEYPFTEQERKIISIITELSQANVEKNFNKKKLKWDVFLEKAAEDKALMLGLSGYFDRRISKILELLKGSQIYWKERGSDHPGMKGYHVMTTAPKAVYSFKKAEDGIIYQLEVSFNGRKIDLQRKGTEIITGEPCWLLHNGCLYGFTDGTDGNKLKPFLNKSEIRIPDKLTDQYLSSFILKASKKFEVTFEGFKMREAPKEIRKVLRLTRGLGDATRVQLEFHYDHLIVTAANRQPVLVQLFRVDNEKILIRFKRDFQLENEASETLVKQGLKSVALSWFAIENAGHTDADAIEWIRNNKTPLEQAGFYIERDFEGMQVNFKKPEIHLESFEGENDWFDIRAMVKIGDISIPFIHLRRNILERNRNWILPDGSMVLLPEAWFNQYAGLFEFGIDEGNILRLHRQHHGLLDAHPLIHGDLSPRLSVEQQSIYTKDVNDTTAPPETLHATLRDYQQKGLSWLWNLRLKQLGACLADDMGLGKTIQIISLLLMVKEKNTDSEASMNGNSFSEKVQLSLFDEPSANSSSSVAAALVVVAPSLIHNWVAELKKFAPTLRVYIHAGQKRQKTISFLQNSDVVLTTYGVIRNDINLLREATFSTIVLDESQLIKNVRSATYQTVRQLRGTQRIVMTGTPIENSLSDLWSQLNFLQPGLLGSFVWFKKEFIYPIEKQQNIQQLEKLRKVIQPFILRRTKEEVAPELPALTQLEHYCEMEEEQRDWYEKQKSAYRNEILKTVSEDGIHKSQFMILKGLMQLRKIAIHPVLDDHNYSGISTKFEQVIDRLEILRKEGKKVLMFSQFVSHLELFRKHFIAENIPFSLLKGSIPMQARAAVVHEFERSKGFRAFLIQLKTGGTGLNLTQADYVFILDPWWNPAAEAQAISRSHRIGQHQPVFAWRFITRNTIEEKILKLQQRKSKLADDTISNGSPLGIISQADLEELFT